MEEPNLLMICVSSFAAVFLLLSVLAAAMRILIWLFPESRAKTDAAGTTWDRNFDFMNDTRNLVSS